VSSKSHLDLRLDVDPGAITTLLDRLEAFSEAAELPPRTSYRLAAICEELTSNVVSYGAKTAAGASFITVGVRHSGPRLDLRIEDDGPPFDPLSLPTPDTHASLESREIGGLGIHIVRTMAQDINYQRIDGLNRLDLVLSAQD
jgi:serine/threonine-protein kinase RsbW